MGARSLLYSRAIKSGWLRAVVLPVFVALFWGLAAHAQETGPTGAGKTPRADKPAAGAIEEVKPEVFYLKDKDGNLQAVPGFSFEEFVKLYRLKNQLEQPEAEPRFSLQRTTITGAAQTDRAEVSVEFKVLVNEAGWIRIPLRLNRAILQEPAGYQGGGECFVHFDETSGYVAWVRGTPGSEHRVTLKMAVPLASVGSGRRLELVLPRATTSQLTLNVPMAKAVAAVSQGATLESSKAAGGGTRFSVLGAAGDFVLTWHEPDAQVATVPVVLDVNGAIAVTLDDRQARTDATLSVRSLGGEFDEFRIRLPAGAKWIPPAETSGYTLEADEQDPSRGIRVRLARKTAGPVDILVSAQQENDLSKADDWLELAGIEVRDAVQQAGHIAVSVAGDWQVVWGARRGVRQIDDLPESLRRKDLTAGFEYFHRAGEPSSLLGRVTRKRTRVSVEPAYLLLVEKDAVRLEARLKYVIRGAKLSRLQIDAPGWEIDDVGPKNLVDVDEALSSEPPRLTIPLQAPTSGELEITLKAHRPVTAGKMLEAPLPRPTADLPGPAEVVVVPVDNVEMTPRPEAFVGLTRQLAAPTIKGPELQQDPLVYRGEAQQAKFVAEVQTHPQSVSVQLASQLEIGRQAARVEQRLSYRVAYEPLDRLTLDVPRAIAAAGILDVSVDGQRLSLVGSPEEIERDGVPLSRLAYALGKQRIGRVEALIRYALPVDKSAADGAALTVGLMMPGDAEVTGNELTITADPGIRVEPQGNAWTMADLPRRQPPRGQRGAPARSDLHLSAKGAAPLVELALQSDDARTTGLTVVERAWIQTWLSDGWRQDRVAYRISSPEARLRLTLPEGCDPSETEVLLDGASVPPTVTPDNDLTIEWPVNSPSKSHVLELRYQLAEQQTGPGQLALEAPKFGDGAWVQRTYWQLALPRDEHVLAENGNWTGEYAWSWRGVGWGRTPLVDQLALETWSGATHQSALPEGANQYAYSSAGPTPRLAVWTAGRSLIVLTGSLVVLVGGLLLIYVARCRHPACLFVAALLLLAPGILYPEAAVLFGQAGALGAVLAIAAALWARSVRRRRPRGIVVRGGASSIERTLSSGRPQRATGLGSHSTTASEPIGMHASAPEAKS